MTARLLSRLLLLERVDREELLTRARATMKTHFDIFAMIAAAFVLLAVGAARAQPPPAPAASAVQANLAPHPAPEQPLPYSHKTHIAMALPCQLCHTNPAPGK